MIALPKISIVTPSFNQGKYLEETIISILSQDYPNLEYIIIDGGSTDNSLEIIKKYKNHLKYWISEPDKGQADAINKGLVHCTGDIFNWINSDDLLAPNALKVIASLYNENTTIAGKVFNFYEDNPSLNDFTQNQNLEFDKFLKLESIYHQPGIWLNLQSIKQTKLNINSNYYFDFFFYLTHFKSKPALSYTNEVLAHFRVHNQSKTSLIQSKSRLEMINFYRELYKLEEYETKKTDIIYVVKYLESVKIVSDWLSLTKKEKGIIAFLKFFFKNLTYLKINFFWKFIFKYILNFDNTRNKNYI